jgi:hypothetical protein
MIVTIINGLIKPLCYNPIHRPSALTNLTNSIKGHPYFSHYSINNKERSRQSSPDVNDLIETLFKTHDVRDQTHCTYVALGLLQHLFFIHRRMFSRLQLIYWDTQYLQPLQTCNTLYTCTEITISSFIYTLLYRRVTMQSVYSVICHLKQCKPIG